MYLVEREKKQATQLAVPMGEKKNLHREKECHSSGFLFTEIYSILRLSS